MRSRLPWTANNKDLLPKSALKAELLAAETIGAVGLNSALGMHRLMTYFAKIGNDVDWLRLHPASPEEDRAQCLQDMRRLCTEAAESITRISSLGTVESKREMLDTLVDEVVRTIQAEQPGRKRFIEVGSMIHVSVLVNVYSVIHALLSLLKNALDAITETGNVRVWTDLSPCKKFALVHIYNSGPPLTREEVNEFLRPGYTTKRADGSLGLGLNIARKAIAASNGTLTLNPPPAGGLEAVVSLPLAKAAPHG